VIDFALFDQALSRHAHLLANSRDPGHEYAMEAAELIGRLTHADTLADFLTLPAYDQLA